MRHNLILLLILFSCFLTAQSISVETSATDIFARQAFDVTYTIENSSNAQFIPPDFSPFQVTAGPFNSSNISIINGRRSESKSITYRLSIEKTGTFTIPSATMNTGSYKKRSKSLKLTVLKPTKENAMAGNNIFLEMTLNDSTIYVGQQLLIDHDIYYGNIEVKGAALVGEFPRDRFLVKQIKSGSRVRKTQMVHNGKMRNKATISRLSLFPLRSGEMTIPIVNFDVDLEKVGAKRRSGFFTFNNYDSKVVRTEALDLDILPLPPNAPASFTGNVGTLSARSNISTKNLGQGEEIFVTLQLIGNGLPAQISAPAWEQDNFQIFDPKLVKEEEKVENGQVVFIKNYQYLVIPEEQGDFKLSIPYSYFDPTSEQYITRNAVISDITVSESAFQQTDATDKNIQAFGSDNTKAWYQKPFVWGIASLLVALLTFVGMRMRKKEVIPIVTPEEASRIVAQQKLSSAKDLLNREETSKYWETLENALRIYLEEKLEIGTTDYSIAAISDKWSEQSYEPQFLNQWKEMVEKINLARYAGQSISNMENLYKEALDWIIQVENKYPSED